MPHLFPAPFREVFLTHLQGRGCAFILCLQSPQHNETGPLGTIMTINNHNSGVGCFQIPDSHSSKLPCTHKQHPHTLLPLWMWPLLLFRAGNLCSCRLQFRGGFPRKPSRPGGMGWPLICSHLVNKEPIWTHPPLALGNSHRGWHRKTRRSNAELRREKGIPEITGHSSLKSWDTAWPRGVFPCP